MMRGGAVALLGASVLLAGCVSSVQDPVGVLSDGAAPLDLEPGLEIQARDCVEGGAHSTYNMDWLEGYLPEPWVLADVTEDVGPQVVTSYGYPAMGPLAGIYHASVVCKSWTRDGEEHENLVFGYVAIRVEAPPFDDSGIDRHYLLDVFSVGDEGIHHSLHDAGFHATVTASAAFEAVGPLIHTVLDDEGHGVYETYFKPKEMGPVPEASRLWMLHKADDGTYHPMAIDLENSGGKHIAGDGQAVFSHLRTGDHAPLPGAAGNVAALGYTGFDRVIRLGPVPEIALAEGFEH